MSTNLQPDRNRPFDEIEENEGDQSNTPAITPSETEEYKEAATERAEEQYSEEWTEKPADSFENPAEEDEQ